MHANSLAWPVGTFKWNGPIINDIKYTCVKISVCYRLISTYNMKWVFLVTLFNVCLSFAYLSLFGKQDVTSALESKNKRTSQKGHKYKVCI